MADSGPGSSTWTCPRCGHSIVTPVPRIPANCPTCNYPDELPEGFQAEADDLEVDETEGERLLRLGRSGASQEEALSAPAEATARQAPSIRPGGRLDRGWLAECIAAALDFEHTLDRIVTAVEAGTPIDYDGIAQATADHYEGDRPHLICGCLAGTHPASIDGIRAAHPDRVGGMV